MGRGSGRFEEAAVSAPADSVLAWESWSLAGKNWRATGDIERTVAAYGHVLERRTRATMLSTELAELLLLVDRPAEAARWFAAIPRQPKNPNFWRWSRRMLGLAEDAAGRAEARDAAWAEAAEAGPSDEYGDVIRAAVRADQLRIAAMANPNEVEAAASALREFADIVAFDALGRLAEARMVAVPAEAEVWRGVARDAYRSLIDLDRTDDVPFVPGASAVHAARRLEALGG